jgi:hypothetical protein
LTKTIHLSLYDDKSSTTKDRIHDLEGRWMSYMSPTKICAYPVLSSPMLVLPFHLDNTCFTSTSHKIITFITFHRRPRNLPSPSTLHTKGSSSSLNSLLNPIPQPHSSSTPLSFQLSVLPSVPKQSLFAPRCRRRLSLALRLLRRWRRARFRGGTRGGGGLCFS